MASVLQVLLFMSAISIVSSFEPVPSGSDTYVVKEPLAKKPRRNAAAKKDCYKSGPLCIFAILSDDSGRWSTAFNSSGGDDAFKEWAMNAMVYLGADSSLELSHEGTIHLVGFMVGIPFRFLPLDEDTSSRFPDASAMILDPILRRLLRRTRARRTPVVGWFRAEFYDCAFYEQPSPLPDGVANLDLSDFSRMIMDDF